MAILSDLNLITFLNNIGYEQKEVKSEKKYFVNKNGSQIRIGHDGITLINNTGHIVSKRKSIDSKVIEAFSESKWTS